MSLIDTEHGSVHEVNVDGMAVFGLEALLLEIEQSKKVAAGAGVVAVEAETFPSE